MKKAFSTITLVFSIFLFGCIPVYAGGLSTHFIETTLEDLELGKSYSIKEETGKALVVVNTTEDKTVDIEIEPEIPVDYNLLPDYEPVPDVSWVKIEKNYFEAIAPGEKAETDIIIIIPEDKEYYGRKYQLYIYSHTAGSATFRTGIMSRILLHISEEPAESSTGAAEEVPN